MLLEKIVTLQLKETVGQLTPMDSNDLRHARWRIVVTYAAGHTPEKLEGPHMPILKSLRALPCVRYDEHRIRIRQRHREKHHLA